VQASSAAKVAHRADGRRTDRSDAPSAELAAVLRRLVHVHVHLRLKVLDDDGDESSRRVTLRLVVTQPFSGEPEPLARPAHVADVHGLHHAIDQQAQAMLLPARLPARVCGERRTRVRSSCVAASVMTWLAGGAVRCPWRSSTATVRRNSAVISLTKVSPTRPPQCSTMVAIGRSSTRRL